MNAYSLFDLTYRAMWFLKYMNVIPCVNNFSYFQSLITIQLLYLMHNFQVLQHIIYYLSKFHCNCFYLILETKLFCLKLGFFVMKFVIYVTRFWQNVQNLIESYGDGAT